MSNNPGHLVADTNRHGLALGIAMSLIAHVAFFVALVIAPPQSLASRPLDQHPEHEEAQAPENKVKLGDPESQVTSISWIGYDEYQQQFSIEPSTIDQPQLTRSPRAPVPTLIEAIETTTSPPLPPEPVAEKSLADASGQAEAQPEATDSIDQTLASIVGPPVELTSDLAVDQVLGDGLPSIETETAEESQEQAEKAQPSRQPAEAAPAPSVSDPGDQSDRDVPFAARFEATESELGKPLSANGLYVTPVRPKPTDYSHVTRALRSPRSPVFHIYFRRDGTVDRVVVAESSKVPQVDSALMNLLYRWRARGPQLESLRKGTESERGETLLIEIRILLHRR